MHTLHIYIKVMKCVNVKGHMLEVFTTHSARSNPNNGVSVVFGTIQTIFLVFLSFFSTHTFWGDNTPPAVKLRRPSRPMQDTGKVVSASKKRGYVIQR